MSWYALFRGTAVETCYNSAIDSGGNIFVACSFTSSVVYESRSGQSVSKYDSSASGRDFLVVCVAVVQHVHDVKPWAC